jgi:hypothetical protein
MAKSKRESATKRARITLASVKKEMEESVHHVLESDTSPVVEKSSCSSG